MQRLVSSHVRLSEECAREKSVGSQVALEIVDALGRHGVALGKLLSDVNAAGDGSFAPALASHLDMLADNIVKAAWRPRRPRACRGRAGLDPNAVLTDVGCGLSSVREGGGVQERGQSKTSSMTNI
ncbi:unnamed protein product [Prorocentrum cordatum]|uniref:Uncharacterized protein n=1 Tax=Prorocentrum cordatum TaxID=2364126 RepID=A0ABN9UE26_9DINO|nr:unnamed protein product [Polarella glacialis]